MIMKGGELFVQLFLAWVEYVIAIGRKIAANLADILGVH